MLTRAKVRADRAEGRQEALGMACELEAPYRPFALTCRLMRVFRTIVQPFVPAMLDPGHDFFLRSLVAAELVGDQHAWYILAAFKQLTQEFLGGSLVAAALH